MNKKAVSICDFVISKKIDILAVVETWLTKVSSTDPNVTEVTNTLQDFNFVHKFRSVRGGGLGFLLRKGLKKEKKM